MSDYNEKLAQLQQRLDKMLEYQEYFYRETKFIQNEIDALKKINQMREAKSQSEAEYKAESKPSLYIPSQKVDDKQPNFSQTEQKTNYQTPPPKESANYQDAQQSQNTNYQPNEQSFFSNYQPAQATKQNSNFEEFIGKNILSIVGILITVIGVGIGAKYAIDRNLISPSMRIGLGYCFAFALITVAYKLKPKYHKFSATVLSGAIAIMYFLAYFAYDFYQLIPQPVAFAVMVALTLYAILSALHFNYQVIAVIGLVGAYAVPFLLSQGSGRVDILFSYISIINLGILAISVKKYWSFLHIASFGLSWLIFLAWYFDKYRYEGNFTLAMFFATLFFAIFYASFAAYSVYHRQKFSIITSVLVLFNALIFFFVGFALLDNASETRNFFGVFAIANAVIHLAVAYIVSRFVASKETLHLLAGLSLFFITISVPLQTDTNLFWTSIFWTIEAVFLFWVGYGKSLNFYKVASYIILALATFTVFIYLSDSKPHWNRTFVGDLSLIKTYTPFFNEPFLINLIYVVGVGFISWLIWYSAKESTLKKDVFNVVKIVVFVVFLIALYNLFRSQIEVYWHLLYIKSATLSLTALNSESQYYLFNQNYSDFNTIWQAVYTMAFLIILSLFNLKRLQNTILGYINLVLNSLVLFGFITYGLYTLSELRESYLTPAKFEGGIGNILIRYVSLCFAGLLVYATYRIYKSDFIQEDIDLSKPFDLFFAFLFWISLSSEAISWMDIFGYQESYKLALSLLWGAYSLAIMGLGIMWRKSHLRFFAIGLFGLTLLKLFFYDLSSLSTIAKTVVFVSLGIMLLISSFLYNKYKGFIFGEDETEESFLK